MSSLLVGLFVSLICIHEDSVYEIGLPSWKFARHFAGLSFNDKKAAKALNYVRSKGVKLFVAINTYPQPQG